MLWTFSSGLILSVAQYQLQPNPRKRSKVPVLERSHHLPFILFFTIFKLSEAQMLTQISSLVSVPT